MNDRPRGQDPNDRIDQLYGRFADRLYRYALMILANPSEAADAVQEVFVGVLRQRTAIVSEEHYLWRAIRNECYSTLRRRRHGGDAGGALLDTATTDDRDPAERLALEQALRALPPEQREVLHLKVYEGLTFQEIADLASESINTVASRYRFALDKMRALLGA